MQESNSLALTGNKTVPSEHEMMVFHTMAEQAIKSNMYGTHKDISSVKMIMLAGRELGIPPMQSLNGGLNIIQGKVEISARIMNALIRRAGHSIKILESTDSICTLQGKRCDNADIATVSYTFAEAQKAQLVKAGGGWTKCPKDMCFARALSRLARQLFSDVIGIGYVEGEIKATDKETVPVEAFDVEVEVENESEWLQKFLALFNDEDKHLANEYLKKVMDHYGWKQVQAIKELLSNEGKMFEMFNKWKNQVKR